MKNPFSRLDNFFRIHPVWRWFLAVIVILFASYTILVPVIARWQMERWLRDNGENRVKIEGVTFNPFTIRLRVHSLFAEGVQSGTLQWKRMAFDTNLWPLHKRRFVISDFVLRDALFTVQQTKSGDWVVGGIRFRVGNGQGNQGKRGKNGWDFGLSNLSLTNVQIHYRGPLVSQQLLIRKAEIDTFESWEVNKKSRFSIQARIDGGDIAIKGTTDPQGGDRSLASTIAIDSLPLKWLSTAFDSFGFPGVNGVLNADFQIQGNLQSPNTYRLDANGRLAVASAATAVTTLPYAVEVSRIAYNGTFRMTHSVPVRLDDVLILTNATVRDTLRDVLVTLIDTGTFRGIEVDDKSNMAIKNTRMKGLKSFANATSKTRNAGPFAVQIRSLEMNSFSIISKQSEIAAGSIALQTLNATLVRDQDGTFRIKGQLPSAKKNKEKQPQKGKQAPPLFSVNRLLIDNQSRVELLDLSTSPRVSLQATDMRFELNEFSTIEDKSPGRYTFTATVQPEGKIQADGAISSLFPKPTVTISSSIENFRLPQLSNYLRTFFGYEIDSGRLDGTTKGEILKGEINIDNQIKINNLEITSVPSESAYDKYKNAFAGMSLESALSILTDKQGDVKLTIPVNGNLSDPEFNFADVIRTAIVNSISGGLNAVFNFPDTTVGSARR
jgi:hypothetical protein